MGEGGDDTYEKDGGDYVDSVAATTLTGGGRGWCGRPERDLEGVGAGEVGQQARSGGRLRGEEDASWACEGPGWGIVKTL